MVLGLAQASLRASCLVNRGVYYNLVEPMRGSGSRSVVEVQGSTARSNTRTDKLLKEALCLEMRP